MATSKKRLGDFLLQENVITPGQLERAVEVQRERGGKLGDILVEMGLCSEEAVLSVLARRAGLGFTAALSALRSIPSEVLARVPGAVARGKNLLPIALEGDVLSVAVSDPFVDFDTVNELKIQTGCQIKLVLSLESEIRKALQRFYPGTEDLPERADDSPAAMDTVLNALLENAAKAGADQVLLEPGLQAVHVRYRIKGVVEPRSDIPMGRHATLAARVKQLSRMNAAESWSPQNGWLRKSLLGRMWEIKVSSLPTAMGEKFIFFFQDAERVLPLDLEKLGMEKESAEAFSRFLEAPRGLVVVAGPARSGKTSTLYAALARLNSPARHIVTIEDPVERMLEGISQTQVRPDARLTLAAGVHVLRRLNPHVLYVSDIRDPETLDAVLQASEESLVLAAVTGSGVFSALERLTEMGASPHILSRSLVGVVAQRLMRAVCAHCREPYTLSLRQLMAQGVGGQEMRSAKRAESFTLYRGRGCGRCLGTGFDGATAVFEAFPVDDTVRRLLSEKAGRATLARETAERTTLREAAVRRALAGATSVEESLRVDDTL